MCAKFASRAFFKAIQREDVYEEFEDIAHIFDHFHFSLIHKLFPSVLPTSYPVSKVLFLDPSITIRGDVTIAQDIQLTKDKPVALADWGDGFLSSKVVWMDLEAMQAGRWESKLYESFMKQSKGFDFDAYEKDFRPTAVSFMDRVFSDTFSDAHVNLPPQLNFSILSAGFGPRYGGYDPSPRIATVTDKDYLEALLPQDFLEGIVAYNPSNNVWVMPMDVEENTAKVNEIAKGQPLILNPLDDVELVRRYEMHKKKSLEYLQAWTYFREPPTSIDTGTKRHH